MPLFVFVSRAFEPRLSDISYLPRWGSNLRPYVSLSIFFLVYFSFFRFRLSFVSLPSCGLKDYNYLNHRDISKAIWQHYPDQREWVLSHIHVFFSFFLRNRETVSWFPVNVNLFPLSISLLTASRQTLSHINGKQSNRRMTRVTARGIHGAEEGESSRPGLWFRLFISFYLRVFFTRFRCKATCVRCLSFRYLLLEKNDVGLHQISRC